MHQMFHLEEISDKKYKFSELQRKYSKMKGWEKDDFRKKHSDFDPVNNLMNCLLSKYSSNKITYYHILTSLI